jgi:prolyl-tRNA editing enzyme YbaK/EbsC (Cys-tRNA(Pro) deacylase)
MNSLNGDFHYNNNTTFTAIENDSFVRLSRLVEATPHVQFVHDRDIPSEAVHVNSIVFEANDGTYSLAILPATHRVDVTKLQQVTGLVLKLCPSDKLCRLCGFAPGTVPPQIGLQPLPAITVIDSSLLDHPFLYGGGGHPELSCVLPLEYLLQQSNVMSAPIAASNNDDDDDDDDAHPFRYKPYFSVEPPNGELVKQILNHPDAENPLQNVDVTIVGRLTSVRKMARCLVFGDLGPPTTDDSSDLYPWRCPGTGQNMAVQIIAGKTLMQRLDLNAEEGAHVIRRLKPGQLLLIEARTNVQSHDSLRNWVLNQTLDLVVYSYLILSTLDDPAEAMAKSLWSKQVSSVLGIRPRPVLVPSVPEDMDETVYLQLQDLYEPEPGERVEDYYRKHILVVDTMETVQQFSNDLSQMLLQLTTQTADDSFATGLVGLDCEWLPSFYTTSRQEPQPVLLLQISLHPLRKVYLLDLQALLRPLQMTSTPLNSLEMAVAQVLGDLLSSQRLIKTGFQVVHDLRQLAASYPHIAALQTIHSVLESSVLAKRVMHINKQRNARTATSSLSRLCETFLGKALQKEEQCSNWSARPLTMEQIEYASLDAAVTPVITELLLKAVHADFFHHPQVGRWKDDRLFLNTLVSWRFLFLDSDTDAQVIRKLNAKRVVGDHFVVNQRKSLA